MDASDPVLSERSVISRSAAGVCWDAGISDRRACECRVEAVCYVLGLVTAGRENGGDGPPQRMTGSSA